MRLRETIAVILLGLSSVAGVSDPGPASQRPATEETWPTVTSECKPWTRWWWLGSAVDTQNLTRSLEEFKQAGFGGVEITPIYGAKGAEEKFIDFLSPRWMSMLAHTTSEAKRLGLGVDMATGTGWPFGGPRVTTEDASARLSRQKYNVAAGDTLKGSLPRGRLQCLMAVSEDGQRIDLTSKVAGGRLDWTAPAGKWRLYAAALDGPVQKVKRAAPGGVGNVLDPFSVPALNRYLTDFDKAFADFRGPKPRGQFHDSYEYYNADWTPDFFAQFQKLRGYDLRERMPALFGDGPAETVARVKCDYRETISDLHLAYVRRWTDWCHAHGFVSRNQAHGGPGNILDAYAAADIPETEVYRDFTERQMPMLKMASSAAHVTGKKLVSAESFTWLDEHFHVSLAHCKTLADTLFLAGVNHLVYHGTPYSPSDAAWPGWQFYAAVNFGPQGGLWRDLPAFNAYVTRVQSVLQSGKPANDVLLYLPMHDKWQTANGMIMPCDTEGRWMEGSAFHKAAMTLWETGFSFDAMSDRQLADATAADYRVILGGSSYRAVVVPGCRVMAPGTLKKLRDLANDGAKILFQGELPSDVPGLNAQEQRRAERRTLLGPFGRPAPSADEKKSGREVHIGKGRFIIGGDLDTVLQGLTASSFENGERMTRYGLRFVRRAVPDGYLYFVVNRGDKSVDRWIPIGSISQSAVVMDPFVPNRVGKAAMGFRADVDPLIYVQLEPGESLIIRTFTRDDIAAKPWLYARPAGPSVPTAGAWKVTFIEGGPLLPAEYVTATLKSWTTRDDADAKRFAGTARYTITFDRPAGTADDWQLDLGKVCESARVKLNGQDLGTLFAPPFRVAAVGQALRPGANTLEVEVTNLAANRVRDLDRRKVNWKYFYDANLASRRGRGVLDASNWPLVDSGLIGPVTLTPMKVFTPGRD
jgi:hypothetical protein